MQGTGMPMAGANQSSSGSWKQNWDPIGRFWNCQTSVKLVFLLGVKSLKPTIAQCQLLKSRAFTQIIPSILCQSCKKSLFSQTFIPTWQLFNRFRLRLQWSQNLKRAGWNLLREKGDKCSVSKPNQTSNLKTFGRRLKSVARERRQMLCFQPLRQPGSLWTKPSRARTGAELGKVWPVSGKKKEFTEYLVLLQIKYKILDEIWIFIFPKFSYQRFFWLSSGLTYLSSRLTN